VFLSAADEEQGRTVVDRVVDPALLRAFAKLRDSTRYRRLMRAIPPSLDPAVVTEIDARLAGVSAEHQVSIP
jgi:hypothetical protein